VGATGGEEGLGLLYGAKMSPRSEVSGASPITPHKAHVPRAPGLPGCRVSQCAGTRPLAPGADGSKFEACLSRPGLCGGLKS